jgi:hypothetical protein
MVMQGAVSVDLQLVNTGGDPLIMWTWHLGLLSQ